MALRAIRAQPEQPVNRGQLVSRGPTGHEPQRPGADPGHTFEQTAPLFGGRTAHHRLEDLTGDPERKFRLEL